MRKKLRPFAWSSNQSTEVKCRNVKHRTAGLWRLRTLRGTHFTFQKTILTALRFLDSIEATVELLCQFPEAGGTISIARPEVEGLRAKLVNGFSNYVILYIATGETIDILRVIRGGQELDQVALQVR